MIISIRLDDNQLLMEALEYLGETYLLMKDLNNAFYVFNNLVNLIV